MVHNQLSPYQAFPYFARSQLGREEFSYLFVECTVTKRVVLPSALEIHPLVTKLAPASLASR